MKARERSILKLFPYEEQVVGFFCDRSHQLGYRVVVRQKRFPDLILQQNGILIRAEVERASLGFISHGHKISGCDMVICMVDNVRRKLRVPVLCLQHHFEEEIEQLLKERQDDDRRQTQERKRLWAKRFNVGCMSFESRESYLTYERIQAQLGIGI